MTTKQKLKQIIATALCTILLLVTVVSLITFAPKVKAEPITQDSIMSLDGDNVEDSTLTNYYSNYDGFSISSNSGFINFARLVNLGKDFTGKTVSLLEDLPEFSTRSVSYFPIGAYNTHERIYSFCGTFDGCGHKIWFRDETTLSGTNAKAILNGDGKKYYLGLFGCLKNAIICNLRLRGLSCDAYRYVENGESCYVGLLAGKSISSQIKDCEILYSSIDGYNSDCCVAGMIGEADEDTKITNCSIRGVRFKNSGTQMYGYCAIVPSGEHNIISNSIFVPSYVDYDSSDAGNYPMGEFCSNTEAIDVNSCLVYSESTEPTAPSSFYARYNNFSHWFYYPNYNSGIPALSALSRKVVISENVYNPSDQKIPNLNIKYVEIDIVGYMDMSNSDIKVYLPNGELSLTIENKIDPDDYIFSNWVIDTDKTDSETLGFKMIARSLIISLRFSTLTIADMSITDNNGIMTYNDKLGYTCSDIKISQSITLQVRITSDGKYYYKIYFQNKNGNSASVTYTVNDSRYYFAFDEVLSENKKIKVQNPYKDDSDGSIIIQETIAELTCNDLLNMNHFENVTLLNMTPIIDTATAGNQTCRYAEKQYIPNFS